MKKFTLMDLAALAIILLPIGYSLWAYQGLPAIVPMHYGIDGKPNSYGSKSEFLAVMLMLPVVSALLYLLLKFLPSIDPKKQVKYGEQTFQKLALGIVIFMAALSIAITFATVNRSFKIDKLILPLAGLLFVFLGNMMHSIKPNYFAGVRTPWTLEDEGNWRATHRLAGKIWFAGGIIITIAMLVLPEKSGFIVFTPCILIMAFIPVIYSYIYFKKHQAKVNS
jgi:uncharacterized membrane protein